MPRPVSINYWRQYANSHITSTMVTVPVFVSLAFSFYEHTLLNARQLLLTTALLRPRCSGSGSRISSVATSLPLCIAAFLRCVEWRGSIVMFVMQLSHRAFINFITSRVVSRLQKLHCCGRDLFQRLKL